MIKIAAILFILLFGHVYYVFADENIEALENALKTARDSKETCLLHKRIGDQYTAREDYKAAATHYIAALSLGRENFSLDERIQIATYLSWAGRMKESLAELDLVLKEEPSNLKARVHHARVASWSGRYDEAIEEANGILRDHPGEKDALLVKANALRWKGIYWKALPVYYDALRKQEDFDTRLGTAYAQLDAGNASGAKKSRSLLKPAYPYQSKELGEFDLHMNRIVRPYLTAGYSYYHDSDENITHRYSAGFGFWLGNWRNFFNYRHTDAEDDFRDNRAEDFSFRTYSKATETLGFGGGLGLTQMANGDSDNYLTWNAGVDVNFLNGVAGVMASRDALTDTAEIIENRIRYTNIVFYLSQKFTDRWNANATYSYRDYSDDNFANEVRLAGTYAVYTRNPYIHLGCRFIYLDFDRQSFGGYFDPDDFVSPQIFGTLSFEKQNLYGYLEPFFGYQSFRRYGERNNDIIGGGYGMLGLRLSRHFSLEMNAEGGNYAVDTTAGWNYYLMGLRILIYL